jgi:predicted amidohydrolase
MKISIHQMCSSTDHSVNVNAMVNAIRQSSLAGASMYFAPEMSLLIDKDRERALHSLTSPSFAASIDKLSSVASEQAIWVHVGSVPVVNERTGKLANRSIVFGPDGAVHGSYDKMHLFDVNLSSGESWRESQAYESGVGPVAVETPFGLMGLTICYDLRFPSLYAKLISMGVTLIAVPAAFTVPTGEAHWHTLLKARAIEAEAFVVAAAQSGHHEDGRQTFGHSLVIDPWGEVLLDMGKSEGLGFADVSIARLMDVRRQIPVHENARDICEQVQVFDLKGQNVLSGKMPVRSQDDW